MDKKLQDKLMDSFPLLYAGKNEPSRYCLTHFGFECFSGWYDILYDLSASLELLIQDWIRAHPSGEKAHPRAHQVKEKFGSLRFYMSFSTEEMFSAISEAEEKSIITCEACGKPGSMRKTGWVYTFCDECFEKTKTGWKPYMDEDR